MRITRATIVLIAVSLLGLAPGAAAATITWTGSAGTNSWHTPSNWDLNRVPAAGDDVIIPDMTPNVNVTHSGGTTTVNSLTSAEAFTLIGSFLNINAASSLNSSFLLGGTLGGTGDVTVSSAMNWTGFGTMEGTGRTIIAPTGSLSISDSNPKTLSRILENHSASASWLNGNMQMNNGVINNEFDGTFTVNVPIDFNFSGFGGTNAVNNAGTLTKAGATVVTANALVQFNNTGTVNLDAGGLTISGGGTNSGTIDVDAGATLTFPATYTHGPAGSLLGQGALTFSNGIHILSGPLSTNRTINISGLSVNFDANYTISGTMNLTTTLGGSGDLTIAGTLNWTGFGAMSGTGRTIFGPTAIVSISDANPKTLGRRLENHSTNVNWTNGNFQMINGAFVNDVDGIINANMASDVFLIGGGGTNAISNAGTLNKTGAGVLTPFIGIPFTNNGTLNIKSGMVDIRGGLVNFAGDTLTGGTYNVAGTLRFPNANIVTNAATIILDGTASAIQNTSGANGLPNFATNTANGTFQIKNGRNFVRSGAFSNAGLLTVGPGDNTFSIDIVTNTGTLTKPGTGTGNVTCATSFTNNGTINVPAGMLILTSLSNFSSGILTGGAYNIGGALRFLNANIGTNAANIILDGPGSAIQDLSGANALGNIFANVTTGALQIKNGRNLALPATFVNQGQVRIGPGASTLSDTGNYVQSSGETTLDGGTLDPTDMADIQAGELQGSGAVLGDVRNSGTCRPIDISVAGDYQQMIQGSLAENIAGTTGGVNYGRLTVTGTALLAGALNITLSGFTPSIGNTFDLLTANLLEVKPATINSPILPNLMGWRFDDVPGVLRLAVINCGPGDADNDGVGDACDTPPDLSWHTIDGGGAVSSGGDFKLSATIGQHDAGPADGGMTGGTFTLVGGFWPGCEIAEEPTCSLPGDMNLDGLRNGRDIRQFAGCVIGGGSQDCSCADMNASGAADTSDIGPFVQVLLN